MPFHPFVDGLAEKSRVVNHRSIFLSNGSGFLLMFKFRCGGGF